MGFNSWLHSIADAGREILFGRNHKNKRGRQNKTIAMLCEELLSSRGEALGTALARDLVITYRALSEQERLDFFQLLLSNYSPDPTEILASAESYKARKDYESLQALSNAVEAPRQKLLRRINMAPGGTETIVKMREHLLSLLKQHPDLAVVDADFSHLLRSWFNRGFLTLKKIDWKTSADVLEKLMAYEAVHTIKSWDDLHRRLAEDRRCYAFFHPALPDEPLIFVQVALVEGLASSIQKLLEPYQPEYDIKASDTAIFYSISDCQQGLKGVSFGNFLIKQVVMELRAEMPNISQFATLSPIPGFTRWLDIRLDNKSSGLLDAEEAAQLKGLKQAGWQPQGKQVETLKPLLTRLCAHYLYHEKKAGQPIDPVARFHLRNGALIGRLNWLGDTSAKGIQQSAGMLVNYCYDLDRVEKHHEDYVNDGAIAALDDFMTLLR